MRDLVWSSNLKQHNKAKADLLNIFSNTEKKELKKMM